MEASKFRREFSKLVRDSQRQNPDKYSCQIQIADKHNENQRSDQPDDLIRFSDDEVSDKQEEFLLRSNDCKKKLVNILNRRLVHVIDREKVLTDHKICKKIKENDKNEIKYFLLFKKLAISALEALCEETDEQAANNVKKILNEIDILLLHKTMVDCYMLREIKDNEISELASDTAIKTHILIKHMEDLGAYTVPSKCPEEKKDKKDINNLYYHYGDNNSCYEKEHFQKAWNYCLKWSRSVEIIYIKKPDAKYCEKKLMKVYFRLHQEDTMTQKEESIVKHAVNCGAPKKRLMEFLHGMKSIEGRVHPWTLKKLFGNPLPFFRTNFISFTEILNYILIFWTIMMNVLLLIAWESAKMKSEYNYNLPDTVTSNRSSLNRYCVDTACYNRNVSNSMFTPANCSHSLCVSKASNPTVPDINHHPHWFFDYVLYICGSIHLLMSLIMASCFFIMHIPYVALPCPRKVSYKFYLFMFGKDIPPDHFNKEIPKYFKIKIHHFLFKSLYMIGFVGSSIASLKLYGYFYCLCLLHIAVDNKILKRVTDAITRNTKQLFLIGILSLGVMFIYSVAAFALFADDFDNRESQYCESILQCYVTITYFILIRRVSTYPNNFKDFALRLIIFDVTAYVLISVIGMSLISAIITSTFIDLRNKWWKIERDKKQICFICQIFSSTFEKKAQGFDHHIFNDHYMFNYVYFKLHIDKVDLCKRNIMEKYYFEMIEDEDIRVFPLRSAKCLN